MPSVLFLQHLYLLAFFNQSISLLLMMLPKIVSLIQDYPQRDDNGSTLKAVYKDRTRFQRDKEDLICEILNKNISKIQQGIKKQEKDKPPSKLYYQTPSIKFQQQFKSTQYAKTQNKGHFPSRQKAYRLSNGQNKPRYFDQYMRELKGKHHENVIKTEYIQNDSDEDYQFINNFIKNPKAPAPTITINMASNAQLGIDRVLWKTNPKAAAINESKGVHSHNESTTVMSKFYHSQNHSIKMRKTEASSQLSKISLNDASNKQSHTIALPTVQKDTKKYEQSEMKEHSAEKTIIQTINKTAERPKTNEATINRHEKTIKPPKVDQQLILQNKIKNILKQEVSVAQQERQKDKQCSQVYNYDQQSNIFTKAPQKPRTNPQQIKQPFKNVKEIFKIRDEQRFKKDLKQEQQRQLNKIEIKKKLKSDLFDGCAELSYRKYFSRQDSSPAKQQISSKRESERGPVASHKDSEPFSYIEEKQGALGSRPRPQVTKQAGSENVKPLIQENNKIQKVIVQNDGIPEIKPSRVDQQPEGQIQSQGISDPESPPGSFLQERQQVTKKQVESISNMVSSAVQAVASSIRRLVTSKGSDLVPEKLPINNQKDLKLALSDSQLQNLHPESIKPQKQKPIKPQSISKVFGVAKEKAQESIDFFANLPSDLQSNNSTIKQASSKSQDRQQVMMQLKELQSYSIDSQIFKKDASDHIPKGGIALNDEDKEIQGNDEVYQPIYASISQYRPSHEISDHLKDIDLSEDAISLNNFADAAQSNHGPSIFDISFEQPPKAQQIVNDAKGGKVKRIEIELDSDSSEGQSNQSFKLPHDEDEINLDELSNYESDEQQSQKSNQQGKRVKETVAKTLTPVLEQDLEESEYHKMEIKKKSSLKKDEIDSILL